MHQSRERRLGITATVGLRAVACWRRWRVHQRDGVRGGFDWSEVRPLARRLRVLRLLAISFPSLCFLKVLMRAACGKCCFRIAVSLVVFTFHPSNTIFRDNGLVPSLTTYPHLLLIDAVFPVSIGDK